ncbi:hypothetical protein GOP47_0013441 [Adiantum capillus-veneris]|uniref:Uncharacterized protein n=1 Tax=Adiantum capillus-veneris TaxID=13818 RepID=A0A9D4UNI4_ADICA|nr:hypothetical protein GOP47_0013441 [Adiantum capillus-veneris]
MSLHKSLESITMQFGQIPSVIVNFASLEEACRSVGRILVEAISDLLKEDKLLAPPNVMFIEYGEEEDYDEELYVWEAWVEVDPVSPRTLEACDLTLIRCLPNCTSMSREQVQKALTPFFGPDFHIPDIK